MRFLRSWISGILAATPIKSFQDNSDKRCCLLKNDANSTVLLQSHKDYVKHANKMVKIFKEVSGCPGISVCISIMGEVVYNKNFGYADVENLIPVHNNTVFRIASISKSLTSLIVGRLLDQNKLELDDNIRVYIPEFPEKKIDGIGATLSVRSLLNHTSGIRGYKEVTDENNLLLKKHQKYPEMFNTTRFETTLDACKMFQEDALAHKPGSLYTYSTFAFTVLAFVIEKICLNKGPVFDVPKCTFDKTIVESEKSDNSLSLNNDDTRMPKWARFDFQLQKLFQFLNLSNTYLEYPECIVPSRARQYIRLSSNGKLENTPTVDNSYKWAGGGILSTSTDLIRVADHLAFIYMNCLNFDGVIKRQTLDQLWHVSCIPDQSDFMPGLGWFLAKRSRLAPSHYTDQDNDSVPDRLYALHTGGAVGGTTILLLNLPMRNKHLDNVVPNQLVPNSTLPLEDILTKTAKVVPVCVAILTNLEEVSGITQLAIQLTELFVQYAAQSRANLSNVH